MKNILKSEVENRIKEKFPEQPFEIIEYKNMTSSFVLKCIRCNKIKKYSTTSNFLASKRKGVCSCYNANNKDTIHIKMQQEVLTILKENNFIFKSFYYREDIKKYCAIYECPRCHQENQKTWACIKRNPLCSFCQTKQKMNAQGYQATLRDEYTLLSDYKDELTKVLIRHSCGFCWYIKPVHLINYYGCPICNRKRSKGERKISDYLDSHSIKYEIEKSFGWQSNKKRRYDFYISSKNLIIEYMGEQHYNENSLFKISLQEQQKIDKEKKEECLQKGYQYLAISYHDYKNIFSILDNWFNDYPQGVDFDKSK